IPGDVPSPSAGGARGVLPLATRRLRRDARFARLVQAKRSPPAFAMCVRRRAGYQRAGSRRWRALAHQILETIPHGVPWRIVRRAGFDGQGSMGNGAAMRVAPLGAFYAGDAARAAEEARRSAEPTHWHADGKAGAIAVAAAASVVAAGGDARALFDAAL